MFSLSLWDFEFRVSAITGLDSAELVSQLRAAHAEGGDSRAGVDVLAGRMGDMSDLGIFEAFKVESLTRW